MARCQRCRLQQQQPRQHRRTAGGCTATAALLVGLFASLLPLGAPVSSSTAAAPIRGYDGPIPTPSQLFEDVAAMGEACPSRPHTHMVLTLACFPSADSVIAFVRSWRIHSPATVVVVMTDNKDIYNQLHGPPMVRVIMIKKFATMPWWSWRMWGFLEYLEECGRRSALPKGLVVSDSRDAIALGNVWMHPLAAHAVAQNMTIFSMENQVGAGGRPEPLLIKDEPWDRDMMHKCFDGLQPTELIDHLLNRPLTCAGAMLGSGPAVLEYFRGLMDVVMHEASSKCVLVADQGAHNWLLHVTGGKKSALKFGAMEVFNGQSWLYTASVAMPIQVDKYGVISVHREGWTMHPVYIHKYDRNKTVYAVVQQLYNMTNLLV